MKFIFLIVVLLATFNIYAAEKVESKDECENIPKTIKGKFLETLQGEGCKNDKEKKDDSYKNKDLDILKKYLSQD